MNNCLNILLIALSLHGGRWDLTEDQRYSLSSVTCSIVEKVDEPLDIQILLDEDIPAVNCQRLRQATEDMVADLCAINSNLAMRDWCDPKDWHLDSVEFTDHDVNGKKVTTPVYPYALLRYKGKQRYIPLLQDSPYRTMEENINSSIEALEYRFAQAINGLQRTQKIKVAFLEGHGELSEHDVYDWCRELSFDFQVDRGVLGEEVGVLDDYKAVIVAAPQSELSETDKFIIDQYIMQGGRVMWLVDGTQVSEDMLMQDGYSPVLGEDYGIRDMLFIYGARVNPVLVQDLQCQMRPVNISGDPTNPQLQMMPWVYAPLLNTNEDSPVTKGVAPILSEYVSEVEAVGGANQINKCILLATSTASRKMGVPAEVSVMDLNPNPDMFTMAFIPVAMSLEGEFPSLFAHRMAPGNLPNIKVQKKSVPTRQIVVGCSSLAVNKWMQNKPLPVGYDIYARRQYGNQDFLTNCILWLTDENGLMELRAKHVKLRLLNMQRAEQNKRTIQMVSIIGPILVLAMVGAVVLIIRRKKYIK